MSDPYGGPPPPNPYGTQPNPYGAPPPTQPQQPNPYASPAGPVGDPDHRPLTLTLVMWGMILGALLVLVSAALTLTHLDIIREAARAQAEKSAQPGIDASTMVNGTVAVAIGSAVVGAVIEVGLWIWMAIANAKGIAWARIVATCFGGIGVISALAGIGGSAIGSTAKIPGAPVVAVVDLLLAITLLVLLWLRPSSAFYAAVTASRRGAQQRY
ncbi:MAG: hypothetical protein J2O46_05035 [Nocardioides sp.]|nr:hypothetical protein [Nocardioides sp.]